MVPPGTVIGASPSNRAVMLPVTEPLAVLPITCEAENPTLPVIHGLIACALAVLRSDAEENADEGRLETSIA